MAQHTSRGTQGKSHIRSRGNNEVEAVAHLFLIKTLLITLHIQLEGILWFPEAPWEEMTYNKLTPLVSVTQPSPEAALQVLLYKLVHSCL